MTRIRIARRASLEILRAEASEELAVVIEERLRHGEDPWSFMQELPSVDELVIRFLRAEAVVDDPGSMPPHVQEYRILRQIALEHPDLTRTVWRLIGDDEAPEEPVSR
ncbi:tryptophan synthase subunit alpha [Microbacterium sp. LRZ72]|uniref:tryptophan synthase subunit alpha n=1 Tax=Microbacterium sp. LRZ72 TaxID=2942481 RepID=UPI0029AC0A88|nr:tryptophan synthase subunit alpha [Microbacterium sp. LRZ72]MDX2375448.1 tryptophan synthase subunit alpha [Microbacterium sp. LRZ72]